MTTGASTRCGRPRRGSPTARHHGGVELVESQEIDSGEIVIQAVTGTSVCRAGVELVRDAVQAEVAPRHDVRISRAQDDRSRRGRGCKISIDGEIAAKTPVTVSVARGAIEVAAPREGQFPAKPER